jgi:hypothetical protein
LPPLPSPPPHPPPQHLAGTAPLRRSALILRLRQSRSRGRGRRAQASLGLPPVSRLGV